MRTVAVIVDGIIVAVRKIPTAHIVYIAVAIIVNSCYAVKLGIVTPDVACYINMIIIDAESITATKAPFPVESFHASSILRRFNPTYHRSSDPRTVEL